MLDKNILFFALISKLHVCKIGFASNFFLLNSKLDKSYVITQKVHE